MLSRKWQGLRMIELPFALTGEEILRSVLRAWVDGKERIADISATQSVEQDGKRVLVLTWYYPESNWRIKTQVLPDDGWILKRYENCNDRGEFVDRTEVDQFETVSGIVFPKSGRAEHYIRGNVLGTTTTFAVEFIETRAGRIPDSLFRFEFPPDAILYDSDSKVTIRNSEVAQSYLAEIVRRLGPPRRQWLKWAGVAAGAVGVLVIIAAALWRRRRRGRLLPANS